MAPNSQEAMAVAMPKPAPKSSQTFPPHHVQRRTLHAPKVKLDRGCQLVAPGSTPPCGPRQRLRRPAPGHHHAGRPLTPAPRQRPPPRRPHHPRPRQAPPARAARRRPPIAGQYGAPYRASKFHSVLGRDDRAGYQHQIQTRDKCKGAADRRPLCFRLQPRRF